MIFQNMSCLRLARVALCTSGAFVHQAGEVAWPISKDSAPRALFLSLDTPTTFANRARWMKARKVSVARQLHHPHEAQASVVVITDQQATECRRRRVDHEVGERKLALVSDGGIDLALQTLDEFLPYVIRRLYGLDNADKQKNITSTWYNLLYTTYTDTIYKYMSETKTCRHAVRTGCPVSHGKAISKSHHNNETKNEHLWCAAW